MVYLHYKKGELIMKEGDYGLSIYKILKGKVKIFTTSGKTVTSLATLGPGEIFTEETFLSGLLEPRSASARAIKNTELEVWHPARLSEEYDQMPLIIKYIIDQSLNHLNQMDRYVDLQTKKKEEEEKKRLEKEPEGSLRRYYRREFNRECVYCPPGSSRMDKLTGQIKNISLHGVGMSVSAKNTVNFPHRRGDEFEISTTLPNGQGLDVLGKVRWVTKDDILGQLHLGVEFIELTKQASRRLGFFLMR